MLPDGYYFACYVLQGQRHQQKSTVKSWKENQLALPDAIAF